MQNRVISVSLGFLVGGLLTTACDEGKKAPSKPAATEAASASTAKPTKPAVDRSAFSAFSALPKNMDSESNPGTDAKVALGRMLYFDKRLSKADDISCNSCHDLAAYGVDGQPTSPGHKGQRGGRNSPTVYNAALHVAQFWDGRAADVEEQAGGPVLNPIEMAMPDEASVVAKLSKIVGYRDAFKKAFPKDEKALSYKNMTMAIGAFERKLTTPSKWDAFLSGKDDALSAAELKGAALFVKTGCGNCHSGALLGGTSYRKLGEVKAWPDLKDEGRKAFSKKDNEKFFFKVPSLRNIEKTGPYFHNGGVKALGQAVKMMATHQLGKELTNTEIESIVTFLKTLTGSLPKALIAAPTLP